MMPPDPMTPHRAPVAQRQRRGQRANLSGEAAENAVARHFEGKGAVLVSRRWRGQGGEIDLIFRESGVIVFCEVKKARTFEIALSRLSGAQMLRIHAAASEFLGTLADGQLSDVRFDLALVDQVGAVRVMENAFGHF